MWRERARKMQAAWTSLEVILEFYININKAEQNSRTCIRKRMHSFDSAIGLKFMNNIAHKAKRLFVYHNNI